MRVMVKFGFSASISSNASRSYPTLPGRRRWTLFEKRPIQFQVRVFFPQPQQLSPLGLRHLSKSGLVAGTVCGDPTAQRELIDSELAGDGRDRSAGSDDQLHRLVFVFRGELPTCC